MKSFRITSQWSPWGKSKNWGFVPFSIWSTDDFFGIVLFNFCFEWSRSELGERVHDAWRGSKRPHGYGWPK